MKKIVILARSLRRRQRESKVFTMLFISILSQLIKKPWIPSLASSAENDTVES